MTTELPEGITAEAVHQLRTFRHDNSIMPTAAPVLGEAATGQEVRDLLLFAAAYAQRDLTLPRNLEALRVIRLVPEDAGAALFEGVTP